MIKVTIQTSMQRTSVVCDPDEATPRKLFEEAGIDYSTTVNQLDGCTLIHGELDKTLSEFKINKDCYLVASVKTTNQQA